MIAMPPRRTVRDIIDPDPLRQMQEDIQDIKENHLRHIYERLSGLEAKVAILLALGTAVLAGVITQLLQR